MCFLQGFKCKVIVDKIRKCLVAYVFVESPAQRLERILGDWVHALRAEQGNKVINIVIVNCERMCLEFGSLSVLVFDGMAVKVVNKKRDSYIRGEVIAACACRNSAFFTYLGVSVFALET